MVHRVRFALLAASLQLCLFGGCGSESGAAPSSRPAGAGLVHSTHSRPTEEPRPSKPEAISEIETEEQAELRHIEEIEAQIAQLARRSLALLLELEAFGKRDGWAPLAAAAASRHPGAIWDSLTSPFTWELVRLAIGSSIDYPALSSRGADAVFSSMAQTTSLATSKSSQKSSLQRVSFWLVRRFRLDIVVTRELPSYASAASPAVTGRLSARASLFVARNAGRIVSWTSVSESGSFAYRTQEWYRLIEHLEVDPLLSAVRSLCDDLCELINVEDANARASLYNALHARLLEDAWRERWWGSELRVTGDDLICLIVDLRDKHGKPCVPAEFVASLDELLKIGDAFEHESARWTSLGLRTKDNDIVDARQTIVDLEESVMDMLYELSPVVAALSESPELRNEHTRLLRAFEACRNALNLAHFTRTSKR